MTHRMSDRLQFGSINMLTTSGVDYGPTKAMKRAARNNSSARKRRERAQNQHDLHNKRPVTLAKAPWEGEQ